MADPTHTEHQALFARRTILPTDYADYGGAVVRWDDLAKAYPDCSCGCRWARWLAGALGGDWCICARPDGPRFGLLTCEHQAGAGCFEPRQRQRRRKGEVGDG